MHQGQGVFSTGNSYATNYRIGGSQSNAQPHALGGVGVPPPPTYSSAISGSYHNVPVTQQHHGATVAPYPAQGNTAGNVSYLNGGPTVANGQNVGKPFCTPCVGCGIFFGIIFVVVILPAIIYYAVVSIRDS
ncbi:uncharacterized protein LOC128218194 [Mya arenaria]|uniref:uncharacterized protein LOC128218194 n=1 Tax=Mya arenaria TaxID=6604 RepID=UPI0022E6E9BF|nr:uncharacterized protein LOC128218194 [Mya arenaria]